MVASVSSIPVSVPTYAAMGVQEYVPTGWPTDSGIGVVATTPIIATTTVPSVAYVLSNEDMADLDRRMREAARILAMGAVRAAMAARVATVSCVPSVTYMGVPTVQ